MSSIWKEIRLDGGIHGLAAGSGTTVVLLSGWPEIAEAYSEIIPQLAQNHQVLALDPPGLGESDPAEKGYDTANVAKLLMNAVKSCTPRRIHLVGHDVGAGSPMRGLLSFPDTSKV